MNVKPGRNVFKTAAWFCFAGCIWCCVSCRPVSLFSGLDAPDTERISRLTGEKLIVVLEQNAGSGQFYSQLTAPQRNRILSCLLPLVDSCEGTVPGSKPAVLSCRAAVAAVDILVHTDDLVYGVIYNLADPVLDILPEKNVSAESLFKAYTEPLRRSVLSVGAAGAESLVAACFAHLYLIARCYEQTVFYASPGFFSGGDIQKYVVAGLISGLVAGTMDVWTDVRDDVAAVAERIARVYVETAAGNDGSGKILRETCTGVESDLIEAGVSIGTSIQAAYLNQFNVKAAGLEQLAAVAGFETVAAAADVLRTLGGKAGF